MLHSQGALYELLSYQLSKHPNQTTQIKLQYYRSFKN